MTCFPAEQDSSDGKKGPLVDPKHDAHCARDGVFFPHDAHTRRAEGLVVTFDACRQGIDHARVIDAAGARELFIRVVLA